VVHCVELRTLVGAGDVSAVNVFKSFTSSPCAPMAPSAKASYWRILIVDDDFEYEISCHGSSYETDIISEYERRGLPIAPNLFRIVLFNMSRGCCWDHIKHWNDNPKFNAYKPEIEKLMVLV
jgi:hypothetical protein